MKNNPIEKEKLLTCYSCNGVGNHISSFVNLNNLVMNNYGEVGFSTDIHGDVDTNIPREDCHMCNGDGVFLYKHKKNAFSIDDLKNLLKSQQARQDMSYEEMAGGNVFIKWLQRIEMEFSK